MIFFNVNFGNTFEINNVFKKRREKLLNKQIIIINLKQQQQTRILMHKVHHIS